MNSPNYYLHRGAVSGHCCPLPILSDPWIKSQLYFFGYFSLDAYLWSLPLMILLTSLRKWKALTHLKLVKREPCYLTPPCINEQLEASLVFTGVRKAQGLLVYIWQEPVIYLEFQHGAGYTSPFTPWAVDGCKAMVAGHPSLSVLVTSFFTNTAINIPSLDLAIFWRASVLVSHYFCPALLNCFFSQKHWLWSALVCLGGLGSTLCPGGRISWGDP